MGLDMYLEKKRFIGGQYNHRNVQGSAKLTVYAGTEHEQLIEIPANEISSIVHPAGYWRKANQIHKWFVDNVQGGVDECQRTYVDVEQLAELRSICQEILKAKKNDKPESGNFISEKLSKLISEKLPPTSGFFFGSTAQHQHYFQDLEHTVDVLKDLDEECEYYYQSSW